MASEETVPGATIAGFARELADWRINGCPGYGFAEDLKPRVRKAAKRLGKSYSEAWSEVHREAYRLIDAAEEVRRTMP
jgi:GTP-binding protein EngB required for normal cell division